MESELKEMRTENQVLQETLQSLHEEKIKIDQSMRAYEQKHGVVGLSGMVPVMDFNSGENDKMDQLKEKSLNELKQMASQLR